MRCDDCVHCIIYEDQSEDMRPPSAACSKGHEIVNGGIMRWTRLLPKEEKCEDYQEGEPEFV